MSPFSEQEQTELQSHRQLATIFRHQLRISRQELKHREHQLAGWLARAAPVPFDQVERQGERLGMLSLRRQGLREPELERPILRLGLERGPQRRKIFAGMPFERQLRLQGLGLGLEKTTPFELLDRRPGLLRPSQSQRHATEPELDRHILGH